MMKLYWTKNGIPHGYLCDRPIHLVYRVEGCAPVGELRRLHDELTEQLKFLRKQNVDEATIQRLLDEHFTVYDQLLDAQDQSKYILADERAARIVIQSWLDLMERGEIVVYAICIMGNHVHVILRGADGVPEREIGQLVNRHKRFTARRIQEACGWEPRVWDDGFYDRYVRYGTFEEVLWYVLRNAVKAGLVGDWKDWAHTWVDERCLR